MSRCFPYPQPGHTLSSANKDALIESIKLQKEKGKAKDKEQRRQDKKREKKERKEEKGRKEERKEEKERKKEKKERKKEKKEREKEKKENANQKLNKSDVPGHIGEKLWANMKSELLHKGHEAEPDQLERSSLTEEHGHAMRSNPPSCSSDSSENSNKRKRQSSPEDVNRVHGKVIRIKYSKKPEDSKSPANEQQLCSTSGSRQFPSPPESGADLTYNKQVSRSTSNEPSKIGQASTHRIGGGQTRSTAQQIKTAIATGKTEVPPVKSAVMTPMQKIELHYNTLFEDWAPLQLQDTSLPDDLGWLFQGKNQDKSTEKKPVSGNASMPCSASQALWPHARYLQEVDVYALPFTVPF